MKHAVEIDMSDGPVPVAALRAAVHATTHVRDAQVLVTTKPSHLVMAQDSFGRVASVVLRIEWDEQAEEPTHVVMNVGTSTPVGVATDFAAAQARAKHVASLGGI